jgi:hypothetical protein
MAAVVLALLAVFHPLLRGRAILERDLARWVLPTRWFMRDALSRGMIPAWQPWEGLGFPVAADPLHATFYPLALLTLPLPLGWGTAAYMLLHVALGAAGLWRLARRAGVSPEGGAAGAIAWSLAGLTCAQWSTGVLLITMAWIPWVCLAAWSLLAASRRRQGLTREVLTAALVGAATLTSGELYVALMALIPAAVLALAGASTEDALSRPQLRNAALACAVAGAIALALSAPTWLPAVMLMGTTARGGALGAAARDAWSLHPLRLIDLVIPRGLAALNGRGPDPMLREALGDTVFYATLYLGVTSTALACLAPRRRGAGLAWAALGLVALGVLLALGSHTPVLSVVRAVLRPFSHMRTPQKFLIVAHTPFALLVALGADRAIRGASRWPALIALALVASATAVARASFSPPVGAAIALLAAGATVRLGALALALAATHRWRERAAWALPLVVAMDLGQSATTSFGWVDPGRFERVSPLATTVRGAPDRSGRGDAPPRLWHALSLREDEAELITGTAIPRVRAILRAKTNLGSGVAVLPGYDVAIPPETEALSALTRVAALRLLSVDAALLRGECPAGLTRVARPEGLSLCAVNAPMPRAFVAHAATDRGAERASLLAEDVVTARSVVLAPGTARALPRGATRAPSRCVIARWAPGDVTLRCHPDAPGVAVLAEQWAPGWRATVDGREARLLRANRVMLGVEVGAGAQTIHLRYATPGMGAAGALAILGALAAAALAWTSRRPPRDDADPVVREEFPRVTG